MNRRDIMKLFGLGGVAVVLPTVPALAVPTPKVALRDQALREICKPPLFADVYMADGSMFTATVRPGVVSEGRALLTFDTWFTGTVTKVRLFQADRPVVTLSGRDFDTPHVFNGCTVNINLWAAK